MDSLWTHARVGLFCFFHRFSLPLHCSDLHIPAESRNGRPSYSDRSLYPIRIKILFPKLPCWNKHMGMPWLPFFPLDSLWKLRHAYSTEKCYGLNYNMRNPEKNIKDIDVSQILNNLGFPSRIILFRNHVFSLTVWKPGYSYHIFVILS